MKISDLGKNLLRIPTGLCVFLVAVILVGVVMSLVNGTFFEYLIGIGDLFGKLFQKLVDIVIGGIS